MSWRKKEMEMVNELNEKVFNKDPLRVVSTAYYSLDVINSNYIKELKNREKYNPQDFDGSLIEKHKYDYLKRSCGDRIPGYICRFRDGSYWAWILIKWNRCGIIKIYLQLHTLKTMILNLKQSEI